jgi:hypothetical protein
VNWSARKPQNARPLLKAFRSSVAVAAVVWAAINVVSHVSWWQILITLIAIFIIFLIYFIVGMTIFAIADGMLGDFDWFFLLPGRVAGFSVRSLTDLAVLMAGRRRLALRDEWHAHLAGESGHNPVTLRKIGQALGFLAAAIRYRLADSAELAWRPADAVLGSRALSNLFVWGPVIVTLFAIVHHDGRFGLVADVQDPVALARVSNDHGLLTPGQGLG